jgi:hypothetical protein
LSPAAAAPPAEQAQTLYDAGEARFGTDEASSVGMRWHTT